MNNKPGPAQVGSISKAQKLQKDFKVSSVLLQYPKNPKVEAKKSHNAGKKQRGKFSMKLNFACEIFAVKTIIKSNQR